MSGEASVTLANLNQQMARPAEDKTKSQERDIQTKLQGLAIVELFVGIICVVIGAVILGISNDRIAFSDWRPYLVEQIYFFTTGEGMWCGIWIIMAGATGMCAAKSKASRCSKNTHFAFTIAASIFCGPIIIIGGIALKLIFFDNKVVTSSMMILDALQCSFGFVALIFLILDACFVCYADPRCRCCSDESINPIIPIHFERKMIYQSQPAAMVGMDGVIYAQQPTIQFPDASNLQRFILPAARSNVQATVPKESATTSSKNQTSQVIVNRLKPETRSRNKHNSFSSSAKVDLPPTYNDTFS